MLERVCDDVWIERQPLRFFGVEIGTRMTVVRLADGSLFIHSPIALDSKMQEAVDALGQVKALVAPSLFHHLYIGEWAKAYPRASLSACPGLERKRKDLNWSAILKVFFSAWQMANEVVFFHRKSRTIISSDFVFNLGSHPSRLTRTVARMVGQRAPGITLLERILIRNRAAAREQVGRIVAWNAERIVLGHGGIIESNGTDVVRRAYQWL